MLNRSLDGRARTFFEQQSVDGLYCILSLANEQKAAAPPVSVVSPPQSGGDSDSGSSSSSSQSSSSSSSTSSKKRKKTKQPPPRKADDPRVFVLNRGTAVFGSSPGIDQQETTNANVLKDPFVSKTHFKVAQQCPFCAPVGLVLTLVPCSCRSRRSTASTL